LYTEMYLLLIMHWAFDYYRPIFGLIFILAPVTLNWNFFNEISHTKSSTFKILNFTHVLPHVVQSLYNEQIFWTCLYRIWRVC